MKAKGGAVSAELINARRIGKTLVSKPRARGKELWTAGYPEACSKAAERAQQGGIALLGQVW